MVTVILDLEDYIVKANNQLENNLLYQRLNEDPVTKHTKMVNTAAKNLRGKNFLEIAPQKRSKKS